MTTSLLEHLQQQIQALDQLDQYELKIRLDHEYMYVPAAQLLSNTEQATWLRSLDHAQTQLIDRRSIDDSWQLSRLAIDAELAQDDTALNQIYRSLVLLPVRAYPKPQFTDRSGIFLPGSEVTIPMDTHTDKTYDQILDQTALAYADLNPVVMWSGGVDSTAILAALVKNNIQFSVAFDTNSQAEAPNMYQHVLANFDCLPLNNYNLGKPGPFQMIKQPVTDRIIVTGDCNDQIFPILAHHVALGKMFFKYHVERVGTDNIDDFYQQPLSNDIKYMSAYDYFVANHSRIHQCDPAQSQSLYDTELAPKLSQFPIATEYAYQLISGFRFIFKYQMHLDNLDNMTKRNTLNNRFQAFYHTDDFQRWFITNFENTFATESTTYLTMKTRLKQYSYDVFKMDEILDQHKRASSPLPDHLNLPDSISNSIMTIGDN
jgi:hypothetical protein